MARRRSFFRHHLPDMAEAGLLWVLLFLFGLLSPERASNAGGAIARTIGPRIGISRRARRNLQRAFPDKDEQEIETLLRASWENLGRIAGEYPHLQRIANPDGPYVEIRGLEVVEAAAARGRPMLFLSCHLANFEILGAVARACGYPLALIYRGANNPYTEALFRRVRRAGAELLPKGSGGARRAISLMEAGQHVAMLADVKMNAGIPIPFFGRDAMTATAPAHLALRFDAPVIMGHTERLGPARYRVTVSELPIPRGGDPAAATIDILIRINAAYESWIRASPGDWLWLHRRWPD